MTRVPLTSRSGNHPLVARRAVLRGGALAAVVVPLASCTSQAEPPAPDPLAELVAQARTDAADAEAISKSVPDLAAVASEIAKARTEHAQILQREVDRLRPPSTTSASAPSSSAPPTYGSANWKIAKTKLVDALRAAEQKTAMLVPTVPRYRAGMLGSVAAGCAGLREVLG